MFAKLQKMIINFIMSVCLSAWNNAVEVDEIWYLRIFKKFVEKITVWLKSKKNNGYFTWRPVYIYETIDWLICIWVRGLSAPMHLGLNYDGPFVPHIESWEPRSLAIAPDGPQA